MKKLLLSIAAATVCGTSLAEGYVGLGGGVGLVYYQQGALIAQDDMAMSYKLFAGNNFNRNLGMEIGYEHYDDFSQTLSSGLIEYRGYTTYVDLTGALPLGASFSAIGRVGVAWTGLEAKSGSNATAHETGPRIGAGFQYDFSNFGARLEYVYNFKLGNNDPGSTGEVDMYNLTASLLYRF